MRPNVDKSEMNVDNVDNFPDLSTFFRETGTKSFVIKEVAFLPTLHTLCYEKVICLPSNYRKPFTEGRHIFSWLKPVNRR